MFPYGGPSSAEQALLAAAQRGSRDAQFSLAQFYHRERRYQDAEYWYGQAAAKGHGGAAAALGRYASHHSRQDRQQARRQEQYEQQQQRQRELDREMQRIRERQQAESQADEENIRFLRAFAEKAETNYARCIAEYNQQNDDFRTGRSAVSGDMMKLSYYLSDWMGDYGAFIDRASYKGGSGTYLRAAQEQFRKQGKSDMQVLHEIRASRVGQTIWAQIRR